MDFENIYKRKKIITKLCYMLHKLFIIPKYIDVVLIFSYQQKKDWGYGNCILFLSASQALRCLSFAWITYN